MACTYDPHFAEDFALSARDLYCYGLDVVVALATASLRASFVALVTAIATVVSGLSFQMASATELITMLTILFSSAGSINLLLATRSKYLLLNDCLKELYYHLQLLQYISCCTTMLSSVVVGVFKLMSRFGYLTADVITMIELIDVASVDQITLTFRP